MTGLPSIVYKGRNGSVELYFRYFDGGRYSPLDFGQVRSMTLVLPNATPRAVFDSRAQPEVIDWQQGGGKVVLNLAGADLAPGIYSVQLVAFDVFHPEGQVLLDGQRPDPILIEIRDVSTAS
ncbi:hypothetical protein M2D07_006645 [Pseudomonas sp. BGr12]|uniref:Uncharacterized protein n=1 Tax=Pseudomonas nitroreducens TaxID=46680 RepID=A0A5R8ZSY0_PSENT|nr:MULTISPECIES: hypothetical protein [Pseudomonas]MDL2426693.1 hypothetical protein [Pseudomonas sp. BJa5]TLP68240.1 hypothetical protein FEA48_30775 [Pseudomonas nitroreducens]